MRKLWIVAAATALLATPAFAADMAVKAAPKAVAPAFSWTGCYLGGEFGVGWGRSAYTFDNGAPSDNTRPKGGIAGALLGCNYQAGITVFGIEGDYEWTDIKGQFFNTTGITSAGDTHLKSDGSIRGRLGITPWDRTLLYVTGGWGFARYSLMGGPDGGPPPTPCCGFNANPQGWTAGVGLEYAIDAHWIGRVEYRHSDFGTSTGALVPVFPAVNISVRDSIDAVRFALSYKFTPFPH